MRRNKKLLVKKGLALVLAAAMMVTGMPAGNAGAEGGGDPDTGNSEPAKLCELTFDGEDALDAGNANATAPNEYTLIDREGNGKALRFEVDRKQYISLTDAEGGSLLKGKDEFTVSYDMASYTNPNGKGNWAFYAAPYERAQDYPNEDYLAASCSGTSRVNVERYFKGRNAATSSTGGAATGAGWHHYDIVVREGGTIILVDGTVATTFDSTTKVSDMLGDGGVFQIGKANWGSGEFAQADIDNFIIYDGITQATAGKIVDAFTYDGLETLFANPLIEDIALPSYHNGADIEWTSEDEDIITNDGVITRGDTDKTVKLIASVSLAGIDGNDTQDYEVTVKKADPIGDHMVAYYNFDDNIKNVNDESDVDTAKAITKPDVDFEGDVAYGDGLLGKAVHLGDYGLQLDKKNIGEDYTVSCWVKTEGNFNNNNVLLFLGYHNPEKWVGICGSSNNSTNVKIWGKGNSLGGTNPEVLTNSAIPSNVWHHIVFTGTKGLFKVYYDGEKLYETAKNNDPLVGENQNIYLSANFWDTKIKALFDEVKVYDNMITEKEVQAEYNNTLVNSAVNNLKLDGINGLTDDITLPANDENGVDISWETSDSSVITDKGVITQRSVDKTATLTATFTKGDVSKTKDYDVKVSKDASIMCELTFDGEGDAAYDAGAAKATVHGDCTLIDREGNGKALALDGSAKYISLTNSEDGSLLAGKEEFTISYDINNQRTGTNWAFYAAPHDNP